MISNERIPLARMNLEKMVFLVSSIWFGFVGSVEGVAECVNMAGCRFEFSVREGMRLVKK